MLRTFHPVDEYRAKLRTSVRTEKRLPLGQSMAVITGLSVLCWGVMGLLVLAARAIL
jgi:hypothetical protein